jgi:dihydroorotate dehydrogenase
MAVNNLITKALHLLPPEAAHQTTLWALKNGLGPVAQPDAATLQTTVPKISKSGKTFSNPIGLAGGAEKKAEALAGWAKMGFGFVEAGTVTLHPRAGNPKPRIWRVGDGQSVINWMGLPGDGLAPFVANLVAFSKTPERSRLRLGVSVGSPEGALDDFRKISLAVAPLADYITLNASCPNVAHEDNAVQAIAAQIKAVRDEAGACPVLLKIGPTRDAEVLKEVISAAMNAGAAGIVATNTVPFDKKSLLKVEPVWPQYDGKPVGGYSGTALLDIACWMVAEIRQLIGKDAPIIGVGGIQSGADALRVMKAGADLIQLYTGLVYKGPGLLEEIKAAIIK